MLVSARDIGTEASPHSANQIPFGAQPSLLITQSDVLSPRTLRILRCSVAVWVSAGLSLTFADNWRGLSWAFLTNWNLFLCFVYFVAAAAVTVHVQQKAQMGDPECAAGADVAGVWVRRLDRILACTFQTVFTLSWLVVLVYWGAMWDTVQLSTPLQWLASVHVHMCPIVWASVEMVVNRVEFQWRHLALPLLLAVAYGLLTMAYVLATGGEFMYPVDVAAIPAYAKVLAVCALVGAMVLIFSAGLVCSRRKSRWTQRRLGHTLQPHMQQLEVSSSSSSPPSVSSSAELDMSSSQESSTV